MLALGCNALQIFSDTLQLKMDELTIYCCLIKLMFVITATLLVFIAAYPTSHEDL